MSIGGHLKLKSFVSISTYAYFGASENSLHTRQKHIEKVLVFIFMLIWVHLETLHTRQKHIEKVLRKQPMNSSFFMCITVLLQPYNCKINL